MSMIEGLKKGARLTQDEVADIVGSAKEWYELPALIGKAQQDKDFKAFAEWLDRPRCKECGDVLLEARQK